MKVSNATRKCNYCQVKIPSSSFSEHKEVHLNYFGVAYEECQLCGYAIDNNDVEDCLDHIIQCHKSVAQCCFCKLTFNNLDDLFYHLKRSYKEVIHCLYRDCRYHSIDYEEIVQHSRAKRHPLKRMMREPVVKCLYEPLDDNLDQFILKTSKIRPNTYKVLYGGNYSQKRKYHEIHRESEIPQYVGDNHPLRYISGTKRQKILELGVSNPSKLLEESLDYSVDLFNRHLARENRHDKQMLLEKMEIFKKHKVLVSEYNDVRTFSCAVCGFKHRNSYGDIRRHVMGIHCKIPKRFIGTLMKTTTTGTKDNSSTNISLESNESSDRAEDDTYVHIEQTIPKDMNKENEVSQPKQRGFKANTVSFKYSKNIFRTICSIENLEATKINNYLRMMDEFSNCGFIIGRDTSSGVLSYNCTACSFVHNNSVSDILKHCLLEHAGFSNYSNTIRRIALLSSKMDRRFNLLPDEEIAKEGWCGHQLSIS